MEERDSRDDEVVLRQVEVAPHANSVIGALAACLNLSGDPTTYEELMGLSGAAFRFQIRQPEWDARATHGTVGFDCLQCVAEQLGRVIRRVYADDRSMAVQIQIDQGRLLIHDQEQAGAIIGYRAGGNDVLIRRFDGSNDAWGAIRDWTWDTLYVVGSAPKTPAPLRVRITHAIERAVSLLDGGEIPDPESGYYWYQSGRDGLQAWAGQLQDQTGASEDDGEGLRIARQANAAMAFGLSDARACATAFLQRQIASLGSSAERHLVRAMTLMSQSSDLALEAHRLALGLRDDLMWDCHTRLQQAKVVSGIASIEGEAAIELRSALTASGMSAPLV